MQIRRLLTGIIIIALLSNVSLAECGIDNLAIPHQSGSAHEAYIYMRISQFMELIIRNKIDSMRELFRFRDRLGGISGLISKDVIKKDGRAYYMFFPEERFYCRITTARRVDDKIGALVQRLTRELEVPFIKSRISRIEIEGRQYYCRYYTIPEGQEGLFKTFLDIFNSHIDSDGEPVREGLEYTHSPPSKTETGYLLSLFNIASIISTIPFLQIFFVRQYLHVLRNRVYYIFMNYAASFLSIVILVPLFSLLGISTTYGILVGLAFLLIALTLSLGIDTYIYKLSTTSILRRFSEKRLKEHQTLITLELIKTSARIIHSGNVETHPLYKTLEEFLYAIGGGSSEPVMTFTVNYLGEITGDGKLGAALSRLRDIYGEGIFGVVKKITLTDKGTPVLYRNGEILIDINAVEDEAVLENILIYGFTKSILELVEEDQGIIEVAAIYQSIKSFNGLSESEKRLLITFWARRANTDYAELLQFISDKDLTEEQLIALIAVYLSGMPQYRDLRINLQDVLDSGIAEARSSREKFGLTIDIYGELIRESPLWRPIIAKAKDTESNMRLLTKFRMIVNRLPDIKASIPDTLHSNNPKELESSA